MLLCQDWLVNKVVVGGKAMKSIFNTQHIFVINVLMYTIVHSASEQSSEKNLEPLLQKLEKTSAKPSKIRSIFLGPKVRRIPGQRFDWEKSPQAKSADIEKQRAKFKEHAAALSKRIAIQEQQEEQERQRQEAHIQQLIFDFSDTFGFKRSLSERIARDPRESNIWQFRLKIEKLRQHLGQEEAVLHDIENQSDDLATSDIQAYTTGIHGRQLQQAYNEQQRKIEGLRNDLAALEDEEERRTRKVSIVSMAKE